jgi:hypothetical protein
MKWIDIYKEKPSINERVLIYRDGILWSARFVVEESFSNRNELEEYFLIDCVFKDESPRYGKENRESAYIIRWWLPYKEIILPNKL